MVLTNNQAYVVAINLGLSISVRGSDGIELGIFETVHKDRCDLTVTYLDRESVQAEALTPDGQAFLELVS